MALHGTEVGDLNSGRGNQMGRAGTATSGLISGGNSPGTARMANTEFWNGSSWTEVADLSVARYGVSGQGGTSSAGMAYGGNNPSDTEIASTEEFSADDFQIKSVTTS
jgi:hypothetical protein